MIRGQTAIVGALTAGDWPAVSAIYADGIETRNATFETRVPTWAAWDAAHLAEPRLVARGDDGVVGWAALSPVSTRPAYAGVAEVSVYVAQAARDRGVGTVLLEALVEASEQHGIWTLQAGVFPENLPSMRLHLSCGFRVVGARDRIGRIEGVWRDVLLLERRSSSVGAH